MNQADTSAHVENVVNKEDASNTSSIVIGVIAVVIIAVLIVVIIFLLKKNQGLKERLDSQYKVTLGDPYQFGWIVFTTDTTRGCSKLILHQQQQVLLLHLPKGTKSALYADDLVMWCKEKHISTAAYRMQQAANKLTERVLRLITGGIKSTPIKAIEDLTNIQIVKDRRDTKTVIQAAKTTCMPSN
ncbi:hypothetical protein RRG08_017650 [Elysia crispata]|uniref:Uncharacterized protein n=1 Tax=Elysia crispata TaxID=231223 RepID=A0AAE0ZB98_9GAST|nr:hypothetical protein RRG08_017650 [Elysia crispata]